MATAAMDADGVVLAFPLLAERYRAHFVIVSMWSGAAAPLSWSVQLLELKYSILDKPQRPRLGDGAAETPVSACQNLHSPLENRR